MDNEVPERTNAGSGHSSRRYLRRHKGGVGATGTGTGCPRTRGEAKRVSWASPELGEKAIPSLSVVVSGAFCVTLTDSRHFRASLGIVGLSKVRCICFGLVPRTLRSHMIAPGPCPKKVAGNSSLISSFTDLWASQLAFASMGCFAKQSGGLCPWSSLPCSSPPLLLFIPCGPGNVFVRDSGPALCLSL